MKLSEIINHFERFFPLRYACEWDNPGLLCGNPEREVHKLFITLDVTEETLKQAIAYGADCIFSHHPVILKPQKSITTDTVSGRILMSAIQNNIALYAAHTNLDIAPDGVNARLARLFHLKNPTLMEKSMIDPKSGLGVIGTIDTCTIDELAKKTKEILKTPFVRICRSQERMVTTAAIGPGACSSLLTAAKSLGADVMITGDVKYHEALETVQNGMCIIDAGHFPTEELAMKIFFDYLNDLRIGFIFAEQRDVFEVI